MALRVAVLLNKALYLCKLLLIVLMVIVNLLFQSIYRTFKAVLDTLPFRFSR